MIIIPENLSEAWFQKSFPEWAQKRTAEVFGLCQEAGIDTDQVLAKYSVEVLKNDVHIKDAQAKDIWNK